MIIQDDLSSLVQEICDYYTHAELSLAYIEYLRGQVLIHSSHTALNEFKDIARSSDIPEKIIIANLYATIVKNEELASTFIDYLHDPVYETLQYVVWRGPCHAVKSSSHQITEIDTIQYSEDSVLPSLAFPKPEYSLFALDELTPPILRRVQTSKVSRFQNVWFFLPPLLRNAFRDIVDAPISTYPKSSEELPNPPKGGWYLYESQHRLPEILRDLIPRVQEDFYIEECTFPGSLQRKKTKSLISMFSLPELYPDSREFDTISTNPLIWMILHGPSSAHLTKSSGIDIIRVYFEMLVKQNLPIKDYVLHFVQDNEVKNNLSAICAGIPHLLELFTKGTWINIESLIDAIMIHDLLPPLYPELPSKEDAGYLNLSTYDKPSIDPMSYREAIYPTLMKGILGILGSLGVLDFLSVIPKQHHYQIKGMQYLSPWDGIVHARITDIGLILLGKQEDEIILTQEVQEDPFLLDQERLLITVRGNAAHRQLAISQFATRVSGNFFQVDASIFTKGCHTVRDIQQKITQFRSLIANELPDNWEQFFHDLIDKSNALIPEPTSIVFKLKDHPELTRLFAVDPELKLLTKRAEGFRIIISKADINRVKKRLGELGFFIE
jgi:hypothetical protein